MTHLQIAALYAAINALITLALAINVMRARMKNKVLIGDGGNEAVLRAMRAHANNVEYVPLVLVLLTLMALVKSSMLLLHIVGICLAVGRLFHGLGLAIESGLSIGRGVGTMLTVVALLVAVVTLLLYALR